MSLKWFHVFFVGASLVLTVLVAAWAVQHGEWLLAFLSLAGGTVLGVYRRSFLQKVAGL